MSRWGKLLDADVHISGTVRYDAEEGAFFAEEFRIEELEAGEISNEQRGWVREGIEIALHETLGHHPIYRLRREDRLGAAAMLTLRDVEVVDQQLRLRLRLRRATDAAVFPR